MAQQLRASVALAEVPGSVPKAHMVVHTSVPPVPGDLTPFSELHGHYTGT